MTVQILTPEWARTVENATAVFLPGTMGPFEVLKGHAAIISTLDKGAVVLRTATGEESIAIKGGVASVKDDLVKLCVEAM